MTPQRMPPRTKPELPVKGEAFARRAAVIYTYQSPLNAGVEVAAASRIRSKLIVESKQFGPTSNSRVENARGLQVASEASVSQSGLDPERVLRWLHALEIQLVGDRTLLRLVPDDGSSNVSDKVNASLLGPTAHVRHSPRKED